MQSATFTDASDPNHRRSSVPVCSTTHSHPYLPQQMTSHHHHHHTEATMDLDPRVSNVLEPLPVSNAQEPLHVTLTIDNNDSNDEPISSIATHVTIDFSTPEWSKPSTARQAPLAGPCGLTQNLVSQNDNVGFTVWTDYDEESSISTPSTAAGAPQRMPSQATLTTESSRKKSIRNSLVVPNIAINNSPWRRPSYPAKADLYYSKAKTWSATHTRPLWAQRTFQYSFYTFLVACFYFFLIGKPFWVGAVHGFW
jgi:hypothetical protein